MRNPTKILATILLSASLAAPVTAQMQPNSPDAIASAVADCWAATGPSSVDAAKLDQAGWKAGTMSRPGGKPITSPMRFFGKSGSGVMLMLMTGDNVCTVVSRVAKLEDIRPTIGAVQKALVALDPLVKTAKSGNSFVFIALPRLAMLDATGTKEKPGTRISVAYKTPEKK